MARRKTLRKNEYQTFPNCFAKDDGQQGKWHEFFQNDHPITFEMGCGKAAWSYGMAKRYPERNFVGVDLKLDRMWYPAGRAIREGQNNIAFLWANLLQIDEQVAENEADELWITFPDPYPKNRQVKHRMTNPAFLKGYQHILKPGGLLHFKTDNLELFQYSLEVFVRQENIKLHQLSFNVYEDDSLPEEVKITTDYERKFMEMGKSINYVSMSFV